MSKKPQAEWLAVTMTPGRGPEYFLPSDPRAGAYQSGVAYIVGRDLSPEKAASLVDGGGYTYCDLPEAPAASETSEPTPEVPAEIEE